MDITKQTALRNEIVYETKIHWIAYVKPIFFISVGFPFLLSIFVVKGLMLIVSGLFALLLIKGIFAYWELKKTRIILSKRFVSLKQGIFSNQVNDISLSKLEGMGVYQNFLGKILNYGTFVVTPREVTQRYFIEKPMEFRSKLLENTI